VIRRRPAAPIRWCGIDYGETIMNPLTLHQSIVIREVYRELGRPAEADDRVQRYYRSRDSMGPAGSAPHMLVRDLKQYARETFYREVFDDERRAIELYEAKEVKGFGEAAGVDKALALLKSRHIGTAIVSESGSVIAAQTVARYLSAHRLTSFFQEIITPAGRFSVEGELVDASFKGATKKDGTIYGKIRDHLKTKGIASEAAAIIGDDPQLDCGHARPYGFYTVQYLGVLDRGGSEQADFAMRDWSEIASIL
jgi:hypothetical protein